MVLQSLLLNEGQINDFQLNFWQPFQVNIS
jgi:hypothetical protein